MYRTPLNPSAHKQLVRHIILRRTRGTSHSRSKTSQPTTSMSPQGTPRRLVLDMAPTRVYRNQRVIYGHMAPLLARSSAVVGSLRFNGII